DCNKPIKPNKKPPKDWVNCWKDISGNDAHVKTWNPNPYRPPKKFNPPKWVKNVIGGKPALYFGPGQEDGLIKQLSTSDRWEGDYTLFLLVKQEESDPKKKSSYFSTGNNTDSMQIGHGADDTTKDSIWLWMNDSDDSTRFTNSSQVEFRIYAVRDGDAKRITYTNGKLESSDDIGTSSRFTDYQINLDRTRQIYNGSYIAEVVLYSRNLDDCEFYDVYKYLLDKYGITGEAIPVGASALNSIYQESLDKNEGIPGTPEGDYIRVDGTADSNIGEIN
ncbi:uncharacterized protein METZ01_LOCUS413012, partial [marine metagenome]